MKARPYLSTLLPLLLTGVLAAQTPETLIEPVAPATSPITEAPPTPDVPPDTPPPVGESPAPVSETAPQTTEPAPESAPAPAAAPFAPLEQQKKEMAASSEGYIIKDAALNDIFEFLAKQAGRQYFHNAKIASPEYLVTGHLNDGNPLQQMEELAFMYGLSLHTKGNTIYALTQAQLSQLPSVEFHYQLKYLRPTDIEQIKELIKPMLSPGSGIVNFEPKTNTIIIIDSAHKIEQARNFLHGIDQTKGQIIVETKILRVNSSAAERVGVNWSSSLGETGTNLSVLRSLNSVFGINSMFGESSSTGLTSNVTGTTTGPGLNSTELIDPMSNLILSPVQLNGVLRALAEGKLAQQISNPTLITEDNEQATISIIDRIPILTTTSTQSTSSGGNPTVTEEVRYKIDTADKAITDYPENHREIGISLVVTPTLLPDGTVRMKMRPRSAQIAEYIQSTVTGNRYPRVTESMIETLARVPDGYSLVVGGFYGEVKNNDKTKVPLLGDLPVINFFFKSKESVSEKSSLVFIVTPKSYDPASRGATGRASATLRASTTLDCDHDWVDPYNPGPAHEPNLKRSLRGLQPQEAPLYPLEGSSEVEPASTRPRVSQAGRNK